MPLIQSNKASGLIRTDPVAQTPVPVPVIHVTNPGYKGIAVDQRWTPIVSMLQHISGSAWTVDYYSQVIDTDTSLGGQRPSSSPVYQQYRKIERLVVRVTAPLTQGQNPDTKAMTYVGKAVVHSFIPNDGDMFVADIGDGQSATFRIMTTTKMAVFKESVYEIEYEVGTTEEEFLLDLETKTVEHLVYRADKLVHGESPIILANHDALLDQANNVVQVILNQYFTRFFNQEYRTLLVPGQVRTVYDPFLVSFITKLLNTDDCLGMSRLKQLNMQEDGVYKHNSLWDAIANQDEVYLQGGFTRVGLAETASFEINPFFTGIRFTGVQLAVYPKDPMIGIHDVTETSIKSLSITELTPSIGGNTEMFEDANTGELPENAATPGLYHVTFDDYYVLSQNFYGETTTQSTLEVMTRNHIQRKALDLEALMNTAKSFSQWGLVEQFYYLPIVLALLRGGRFEP